MRLLRASWLWSFVYSIIYFQTRQVSGTNQSFSGLRYRYYWQANRKKLILPLEKYLKALKDIKVRQKAYQSVFQSVFQGFSIMVFKYGLPDKVTIDIDLIGEAVVQCYVPVVKLLLWQIILGADYMKKN